MKSMRPKPSDRSRGMALIWAVFGAFVLMSSTFITVTLAKTSDARAEVREHRARANALAHAASEAAVAHIASSLRLGLTPQAAGSETLDGEALEYTIFQETAEAQTSSSEGLVQIETVYRIEGVGVQDGVEGRSRRVVRALLIPIFQFAIFFENDMEFYNPAPWVIRGRVHCNSNIYVHAWQPVRFDTNYLRAAGKLLGSAPFASWSLTGLVEPEIRRWVDDPFDPFAPVDYSSLATSETFDALGISTTGGYDSNFAGWDDNGDGDFTDPSDILPFLGGSLELWSAPAGYAGTGDGTTLRTGDHGVKEVVSPELGDFDMYVPSAIGDWQFNAGTGLYESVPIGTGTHSRGDYHASAGLSILSYEDGSWRAFDGLGVEVTADLAGIVTSTTIYDARQAEGSGGSIQLTQVDMAALSASPHFPVNGLVYMAGYGAGPGTDVKGFEVRNGAELAGPLTIVSPDSLYIQGDYNTVDKKPAAVMADAVNLLSNAWDHTKGPGDLPSATETTYNVSIVAGDVASTETHRSGGPHNLPRRHEDWSGVPEYLYGSIVCPFRSERATGAFDNTGDYYRPPDRFWSFDETLNTIGNLPPFTPVIVDVIDTASWTVTP